MDTIIDVSDVTKTYGQGPQRRAALRGTTLSVRRGEWVAVVGPSGCGKSTLLHLVGGLDTPDGGAVRLGGEEVSALGPAARAVLRRGRVGFVFQAYNLVPHLTAAANVELPLRVAGVGRRAARSRAAEVLDSLGLADVAKARPATLSGGQQQRVALARALAARPDVLLADEPTGALDTASARVVVDLFRERNQAGQTIMMVTHDYAVAAEADRVVFLRDGRVTDERVMRGPDVASGGEGDGDGESGASDTASRAGLDDLLGLGHAW